MHIISCVLHFILRCNLVALLSLFDNNTLSRLPCDCVTPAIQVDYTVYYGCSVSGVQVSGGSE